MLGVNLKNVVAFASVFVVISSPTFPEKWRDPYKARTLIGLLCMH